jgi:hypothetical protein
MDSEFSSSCCRTTLLLFEPTDIIVSAVEMKGAPYQIATQPRKRLIEVPGPALQYEHLTIVGEETILHWLDRRFPWPLLLPSQEEPYAKAGTLIAALKHNPRLAIPIWEAHKKESLPHILGSSPSLVDLYLLKALGTIEHQEAPMLHRRIAKSLQEERAAYE